MTGTGSSEGHDASIVFTTVGSREDGHRLARLLVDRGSAACVQLVPIESVYRWEGEVREDEEILLLVKAPTASVAEIEAVIAEAHPYDVPELLHVGMDGGLPTYLQWMVEATGSS